MTLVTVFTVYTVCGNLKLHPVYNYGNCTVFNSDTDASVVFENFKCFFRQCICCNVVVIWNAAEKVVTHTSADNIGLVSSHRKQIEGGFYLFRNICHWKHSFLFCSSV